MAASTPTSTSNLINRAISTIASTNPNLDANKVVLISALQHLLESEACQDDDPLDAQTQQAVMVAIDLLFTNAQILDNSQMVRFLGALYVMVVICVNGLCVDEGDEDVEVD